MDIVLRKTHLWRKTLSYYLGLLLFLSSVSFAATSDVNVTAELSRSRVAAGDIVQLDVKVTGAQEADLPREIIVDGLQIRLSGQSSQVQMVNFSVTSSVIYSYIVIPLQSGTFVIPSIQVRTDGKYFRTSPQQLTVVGTSPPIPTTRTPSRVPLPPMGRAYSSRPSVPQPPSSTASGNQLAFGELIVPKRKIYVGEVIPAEIRFFVNAGYNAELRSGVNFGGEGLLVDRLNDPQRNTLERNGILYNTLSFRTLIAAVKPGPLEIGPATFNIIIEMPEAAPSGMPDVVAQLLGRSGSLSQQHPLTIKSNTIGLDVMPLPKKDRPDDFSGAIGDFQCDAMVLPKKCALGDPISLAITIEGSGNFQTMKAPQLTDTQGWRTYPPTDRSDPPDAIGQHGIKTFETSMIAQRLCTKTPGATFSYFNPTTAKYVTLTIKPLSVEMISQDSTSLLSAPTNAVSTNALIAPVIPAVIPGQQPFTHFLEHSWKTPFHRFYFVIVWIALFLAGLLFALYLAAKEYQRRGGSPQKQKFRKFQKLSLELQSEELDAIAFYNKAADYAGLLLKEDSSRIETLKDIFKRRDELIYGARETRLRAQEKQQVLGKLFSFNDPQSKVSKK